jgi:hypothetical protein
MRLATRDHVLCRRKGMKKASLQEAIEKRKGKEEEERVANPKSQQEECGSS